MPVHVSKRAKDYCTDNQLGDIFTIGWGGQAKFEKQVNRQGCQLKHEHKTTVASLIEKMRSATTLEEAVRIFESQEIVWVHKEEDDKLPKTKRPNSDEEYAKAGIEIVKNQNPIGYLFG